MRLALDCRVVLEDVDAEPDFIEAEINALVNRFWVKLARDPETECWEWTGAKNGSRGYGQIWVAGRLALAHRVAYELMVGPIPEGLELDHLCCNPGCVNPAHMEPVTHRVNTLRGESPSAKNAVKTHCPAGHLYDEANIYRRPDRPSCRRCRACERERMRRYYQRRLLKARADRAS